MIRISIVSRKYGKDPRPQIPPFIMRLNQLNPLGISYRILSRTIEYRVTNPSRLTSFDRSMVHYIDSVRVIPLRLERSTATFIDNYRLGTVDIEDLLRGSNRSLQLNLLHLLEERHRIPSYAKARPNHKFASAHRRGLIRERDHLRILLEDPTIRYTGQRRRSRRRDVFTFRSSRGYGIEHIVESKGRGEVIRSEVYVVRRGIRRTLDAELKSNRERSTAQGTFP